MVGTGENCTVGIHGFCWDMSLARHCMYAVACSQFLCQKLREKGGEKKAICMLSHLAMLPKYMSNVTLHSAHMCMLAHAAAIIQQVYCTIVCQNIIWVFCLFFLYFFLVFLFFFKLYLSIIHCFTYIQVCCWKIKGIAVLD